MTTTLLRRLSLATCALLSLAQTPIGADNQAGQEAESCMARTFQDKYLVTLGDSIAFGWITERFRAVRGTPFVPDEIFPGFEGPMLRTLAIRGIHARSINFSCPGDSTHSFVEGGCWYIPAGFPLHDGLTYHAQLEAVEEFLRGNAGDVAAITISLGPNDVVGLLNSCRQASDPDACILAGAPAVTAGALAHWATILDRLQSLAPEAVVLALVSYDIGALLGDPPAVSEWWADYTAQVLLFWRGGA